MPDTLPNISVPAGTWVNLYAASGIAVGTKIAVQNLTQNEVRITTRATTPPDSTGYTSLLMGMVGTNQAGDSGAWAMSPIGSSVNVGLG